MLSKQGFDLWANQYDQTVQVSEENQRYPFAGYKDILNTIFTEVMQKENSNVLDIGVGTGVLTSKLYEHGHQIHGIDFSTNMIAIAKEKMPEAKLLEWDISNGLPAELLDNKFDFIVSTYTLHHLTDEEKVQLIDQLIPLLKDNGKILIGDIAFETREKLEHCRHESLDYWDDDEFYFVFKELKDKIPKTCHLEFYPISHCGGVFFISQ